MECIISKAVAHNTIVLGSISPINGKFILLQNINNVPIQNSHFIRQSTTIIAEANNKSNPKMIFIESNL